MTRSRIKRKVYSAGPKATSGHPLVDWVFRQFMGVLKDYRVRVSRMKRLVDPTDPRRRLLQGLMDPEVHPSGNWVQILINPARTLHRTRDEELDTLIHELAHVVFPKARERDVARIEKLLAKSLSRTQRSYLKKFLPRHQVKKYPRLWVPGRIATA